MIARCVHEVGGRLAPSYTQCFARVSGFTLWLSSPTHFRPPQHEHAGYLPERARPLPRTQALPRAASAPQGATAASQAQPLVRSSTICYTGTASCNRKSSSARRKNMSSAPKVRRREEEPWSPRHATHIPVRVIWARCCTPRLREVPHVLRAPFRGPVSEHRLAAGEVDAEGAYGRERVALPTGAA